MTDPLDIIDDRRVARSLAENKPIAKVQDYLGLDAAGFLLVALGHLVKAKEKLDQEPPSYAVYHAKHRATYAANHVRLALKVLDELKEETCKKL